MVYLGAESVVHGYGTGDANWEISGPENIFEMHFCGVKELIGSLVSQDIPVHPFLVMVGPGSVSGVHS